MYSLIRPLLFRADAETVHHHTLNLLARAHAYGLIPHTESRTCPTELMGLSLPNPIGLAAGLDKNGDYIDALAALGFGFIEIGTVTPRPQPGNPKPRLFRSPEHNAVLNRMGFNNEGIANLLANVNRARYRGILGINIGKNADTPIERATEDYLYCLEQAYPAASYITVNISSPNTQNLRSLQSGNELAGLLGSLKDKQQQLQGIHGKYVPLAVKIAPDLDEAQIADIVKTVSETEIDAVIATNTTTDKTALGNSPLAAEAGGLSGAPVRPAADRVLAQLAAGLNGRIPLIGVGGIMSAGDALHKRHLGAAAVQLYSGLIYQGPQLLRDCLKAWR